MNDSFGHDVGDKLLKEIGLRIIKELCQSDTLSRLGGDEYAVLLENICKPDLAITIAKRIIKKINQVFNIEGLQIYTSTTIGVVIADEQCLDSSKMIRHADLAMYHAKKAGKNTYYIYNKSLEVEEKNVRQIRHELEQALLNNELILHYQIVMDIQNQVPVGFEALLRWNHPTKGLLSPGSFIQIAEESELILEMDKFMLEQAIKQLLEWREEFNFPMYVSVNISGRQFAHKAFYQEVTRLIKKYQLPKNSLCLEITERVLIDNLRKASLLLNKLKKLGIRILLDDFGTGYSSLSYLHQLPFDVLKIDRSFVNAMGDVVLDNSIINTIMTLANTLNMEVIAEGIENEEQLKLLRDIDCPYGQGYFLSYPLEPSKIHDLLRKMIKNSTENNLI